MIARLIGTLAFDEDGEVIIDVGGVGYRVRVSATLRSRLGREGDSVTLLIDTQVRDNALELYGFAQGDERQAFRKLLGVQGVGAKLALALLSAMTVEQLSTAIAARDRSALSAVPGVGGRLAARIVTELADAMEIGAAVPEASEDTAFHDALSALCNLGYERGRAWQALRRVGAGMSDPAVETLVPAALKVLST